MTREEGLTVKKGDMVGIFQNPVTEDEDSFEGLALVKKIERITDDSIYMKVKFNWTDDLEPIVSRRIDFR